MHTGLTKRDECTAGMKNARCKPYLELKMLRIRKTCEDLRVDVVIMLKWIVETGGVRAQTGLDS
jgi:hypothetical protein